MEGILKRRSAKSRPRSDVQISGGRGSVEMKRKTECEEKERILSVSPSIFYPQGVLKKLLLHHPVTSEAGEESLDSIRTQLYELENAPGLSPQCYLYRFCRVCKRRSNPYRRLFEKFDKDRDGLLSLKEMERGICDLYMADVTAGQLQRPVVLIDADAKSHFDCVSFCAFMCPV